MAAVLDGVRVFDMTLAAVGPWASKLLGQLGAEVIHVEGPNPELAHNIPPTINGSGALYLAANTNKRHVVLDLADDANRTRALHLASSCDVFIQNMRPGAVEGLGLGYDTVAALNPAVIYVSASAYGRVGPMAGEAGIDPLLQAFCGWCSINGPVGSTGEMFRHFAHLDLTTSTAIVEAVLAAVLQRADTGRGQHIEIEMLAAALSLQTNRLAESFVSGAAPVPLGSACASTAPHQAFRCHDGRYLAIGVVAESQWPRLCDALGTAGESLGADPALATNAGRLARRVELADALGAVFATKPLAWWVQQLARATVPHGRFSDLDELRHHPQVLVNGYLEERETERYGPMVFEGPLWRFSETPAVPVEPAGLPGEHNDVVFASLDPVRSVRSADVPVDSTAGLARLGAPLAGTFVVEISDGCSGAFAAARLADLGARVVKIEPPGGASGRGHGPVGAVGAAFDAVNRSKQSIELDLSSETDVGLARRLIEQADVVIEELGPDGEWLLGSLHDVVGEVAPGCVHVAISGWGDQGPWARQPVAELAVQAFAEYTASLGRIGEPPVRLGTDVAAMNTGIVACQAALAGLVARRTIGRGQRVDVSQLGTLLHLRGIMWAARSNPDEWYGFHLDHYTNPPETGYRTGDGLVQFGLRRGDSEDFDELMISLGLVEHLEDERFGNFGRDGAPLGRFSVEAKPIWEQGFATMATDEVVALFHRLGGDAVPFTDYEQIVDHPQTEAIGAMYTVPSAGGGSVRAVAPVWGFGAGSLPEPGPAPALGQHGDAIANEFAPGLSA